MNTTAKANFAISARYLGPIISLDGELTKNAQNLVFARNGTGKSFLSRAFRYLDLQGQGKHLNDAARNLVSDESADGKASFVFSRGADPMGRLQLQKDGDIAIAQLTDTIFHVFSEDFVHEELREQKYILDGKIESQITIDSDTIALTGAQKALGDARTDEQNANVRVGNKFELEKVSELAEKAGIRKQLKEYGAISLEGLLHKFLEKPNAPNPSFASILKDLDSLKAIPSEPTYPLDVDPLPEDDVDLEVLEQSLKRITSFSSVSTDIKKKIELHHGFYESGVAIVRDENRDACPFCEQAITGSDPKAIIDAYIKYFSDEEELHKSELRKFYSALKRKEDALMQTEAWLNRQKSQYDDLKRHVPSMKESDLVDFAKPIELIRVVTAAIKREIEKKANALSVAISLPQKDFIASIVDLNSVIEKNNDKVSVLNKAVEKSDDERKNLQRKACGAFEREFAVHNWPEIEGLRKLREAVKTKTQELASLEKSAPSKDARSRVADTFELLLREFFAEKYIFDRENFTLRRGMHEMVRGPHRTLSDGEKTALAFCYFVARVHLKVKSDGDYKKLFLVFDDPVTSMSYDFVFAIAQTLKNLSISKFGEISLNPSLIDGGKRARPELLLLTHSSYFFNIARTNKVVQKDATFALQSRGGVHNLAPLTKYVAPFEEQLKDIYEISNGVRDADHSTGNTIRSVLEAIGRFCRPDKTTDLSNFIQHLVAEDDIVVKSILINSLSHGTYYDESPSPDDLKLACVETLRVVEKYAAGHLEVLRNGK